MSEKTNFTMIMCIHWVRDLVIFKCQDYLVVSWKHFILVIYDVFLFSPSQTHKILYKL